jgi:hypothetical protein
MQRDETHRVRVAQIATCAAVGASVVALAGCGGGSVVDAGGFTAAQRKAAQAALDRLGPTEIPRRVVAISFQDGQAPSVCLVVPVAGADGVFRLLLTWDSSKPAFVTQAKTVLQATIHSASASRNRFRIFSYGGVGGKPESVSLASAVKRTTLARPAEQCQALANGTLRLAPA